MVGYSEDYTGGSGVVNLTPRPTLLTSVSDLSLFFRRSRLPRVLSLPTPRMSSTPILPATLPEPFHGETPGKPWTDWLRYYTACVFEPPAQQHLRTAQYRARRPLPDEQIPTFATALRRLATDALPHPWLTFPLL